MCHAVVVPDESFIKFAAESAGILFPANVEPHREQGRGIYDINTKEEKLLSVPVT